MRAFDNALVDCANGLRDVREPGAVNVPTFRWRNLLTVVMVAAMYYAAARLGLMLQLPATNASPVWPSSGIGLASVLLFGLRVWPGIALGAFLANLLTLPHTTAGFLGAIGIGLGNTLEHVVALVLIRQFVASPSPFDRARDVIWFMVTAGISCAVAATNGVSILWIAGILPAEMYERAWLTWWLGDTAGILVFAPVLYCWWRVPRLGLSSAQLLELVGLVTWTALVTWLLFGDRLPSEARASLPYLMVATLLWAALRFSQREASSLTLLLSVIAIAYTCRRMSAPGNVTEQGSLLLRFDPVIQANSSLLTLQVFICSAGVTAVSLAAAVGERTHAEAALHESEQQFRLAQQAAHIGTFAWNIQTGLNSWTPELEAMHGLRSGEFPRTQEAWEKLLHPEDRARAIRSVEQAFKTGLLVESEWRVVWPDRSVHWIAARFQVFKDASGQPMRLTGINIDITARKLAEEQLNATLRQLHGLTTHLETVREEERSRIARELHDELGQTLTALKLELAWIKGRLGKEKSRENLQPLADKVDEMSQLIDATIHTMRRIVTELRPGILDELGLAAALEWQGQEFQNRTGIRCSVCVQDASLDRDRSSALFRIVQESLTNVARHAEATAVEIRLNESSNGWNLEVADNGKGMSDLDACSRQSFGLLGMQERAVAAGGTFQVTSKPGQGTKILVQVPSRMNPDPYETVPAGQETESI